MTLNAPIIAMAATPGGRRLLAARRATAACSRFGDAQFYGSTGAMKLERAGASAWARPAGGSGYWLLARDGGMFSFGDADVPRLAAGHRAGARAPATAVAFTGTRTGRGYWIVLADGRVLAVRRRRALRRRARDHDPVAFAVAVVAAAVEPPTLPPQRRSRSIRRSWTASAGGRRSSASARPTTCAARRACRSS